MEKTSWGDMKTNEEVLQLVKETRKSYGFDLEKEEWCRPTDVSSSDDSSHELFVPNSTKIVFNCLLEAGLIK